MGSPRVVNRINAARLVRHIPPRLLGASVGGIIVLTNARTLLRSDWIDAPVGLQWAFYGPIFAIWVAAVVYSFGQYRKDRASESADAITAAQAAEAEAIRAASSRTTRPENAETVATDAGVRP